MSLPITLSSFVEINKSLVIDEQATKSRNIEDLKATWGGRFGHVSQESFRDMEYTLNFDDIDWSYIMEQGITRAAEIFEQEIRMKREQATYQSFAVEAEKLDDENRNAQEAENLEEMDEPVDSSSLTNNSFTEDDEDVKIIYAVSSLWLSDGSDYKPGTTTASLPSIKYTTKYVWCLSMCEIEIIVTDKVKMNTTNVAIKDLYDQAHNSITTRTIKYTDLDTRLKLSGLFNCTDYEPRPISIGFVAEQATFSVLA
ncbi:hypothetical protein G6F56_004533 [Rhizopus delemar]|nr:hypothetical protein G6F56_004533 [Rhizopus delemar]